MKSTSLKAMYLVSGMLLIKNPMQYTYSINLIMHIPISKPSGDEN